MKHKSELRILVGCEESQAVCIALRKRGFQAFSCDLLPCSGGHPEWHYQQDIFDVLHNGTDWDLMIAHPPCTMVAGSSVQWLSHPEDRDLPFDERRPHPKYPNRRKDMWDSIEFVKKLHDSHVKLVAIENPVGLLGTKWRKADQIIQPYHFGDEATKTTCLWLKGLPPLKHTNVVGKGERTFFKSGKNHPKWYAEAYAKAKTKQERQTLRSKTFQGIADAMAQQWGDYLMSMHCNPHVMELF